MNKGLLSLTLPLLCLSCFTAQAASNVEGQWVYQNLGGDNIPAYWTQLPDSSPIVAVIDTGVDITHPDLSQNIWTNSLEENGLPGIDDDGNGYIDDIHGYNFIGNNGDVSEDLPHGTHVAGIIAATQNEFGIIGINPQAKIMPLKFMNGSGGSPQNGARAIRYAVDNGARIINCSWGEEKESQELQDAVKYAREHDVIIVASAGNKGINNDFITHFPSHYPDVITVANHDRYGHLAYFSNYGTRTVDIVAPGEEILSTWQGNQYKEYSGTSMAAPFVSGALSLLLSFEPQLSAKEAEERLYRTGHYQEEFLGKISSAKRIDVKQLLENIEEVAPLPSDAWIRFDLPEPLATDHPYRAKKWWSKRLEIPGAKFIRVHYKRIDFGTSEDKILISGRDRKVYDKASGIHQDFYSSFIVGDLVVFNLMAEDLSPQWGIEVDYLEYQ